MKTLVQIVACWTAVVLLAGCASWFQPTTATVEVVTTNAPAATSSKTPPAAAAPAAQNPYPIPAVPAAVLPPVLVTNHVVVTNGWVVAPAVTNTVEVLRGINSAANPTPFEPLVDWSLRLVPAVLGVVAAWKSRRRAQAIHGMLDTVVTAIETVPSTASIKEHVAAVAAMKDVAKPLDVFVQQVASRVRDAVPNPK